MKNQNMTIVTFEYNNDLMSFFFSFNFVTKSAAVCLLLYIQTNIINK